MRILKGLKQTQLAISLSLASLLLTGCDLLEDLPVGKGFTAKYLCSYTFNSELDPVLVTKQFIAPKVQPFPLVWQIDLDEENQRVDVGDFIFLNEDLNAKAIYRDGIGCTLLVNENEEDARSHNIVPAQGPELPASLPWPMGSAGISPNPPQGLDIEAVNAAVDSAFVETEQPRNTHSLLVAYQGQLIAEQYALGVNENTPLLGWSMTKTVTGTLIGILHDQGLLQLDMEAPIAQWEGSDKQSITLRNLMNMASGLNFNEDYDGFSDVTQMLYKEGDQIAYATSRPLISDPGTDFNYNTGDANLLAYIVQNTVGGSAQAGYDFYQQALFHKVGIDSAFIEVDAVGQFVGGAYGFMTGRDWLRLGQLYLQKGLWEGEQVVSESWIDFVVTPSPAAYYYGGQIWLNTRGNQWPDVPHDAYYFAGHQGQRVVVIPSLELVVVRTGVTEDYDDIGLNEVLRDIIAALPN